MLLGVALGSYLIGAVNSALIISRACNLPDPRTQGSGNPGATNMLRVGKNKGWAVVTLIGDRGQGGTGSGTGTLPCRGTLFACLAVADCGGRRHDGGRPRMAGLLWLPGWQGSGDPWPE